jgi:hypothetical protein
VSKSRGQRRLRLARATITLRHRDAKHHKCGGRGWRGGSRPTSSSSIYSSTWSRAIADGTSLGPGASVHGPGRPVEGVQGLAAHLARATRDHPHHCRGRLARALRPEPEQTLVASDRMARIGRVEIWRGGVRLSMWCLSGSSVAPSPHPSHRTGRADFPYPTLGQDLRPSCHSRNAEVSLAPRWR